MTTSLKKKKNAENLKCHVSCSFDKHNQQNLNIIGPLCEKINTKPLKSEKN